MDRYSGVKYSIVRDTLPALKATVLEDFEEIGKEAGLYTINNHNLTDKEYRHNGNLVDYFSSDDDEKVRGRKRDVLYLNEGPELEWKIVKQLLWRTTAKIIIDYNPSYPESWVYDNILTRADCASITTTFENNPHLTKGQIAELEWMRINDPEGYIVYGLGQRGVLKGQIYKNWKECKELPADLSNAYVIDFGYTNDPACIAEFRRHNRTIYGKEHLYAKGLDNVDLGICLFFAGATNDSIIVADSAEPKSVGELRLGWSLDIDYIRTKVRALNLMREKAGLDQYRMDEQALISLKLALVAGYPVNLARKGPDSIDTGIQLVKQHEVLVTSDSVNAWREYRKYRWAEDKKTGNLLNSPVDEWNHFMDCLRYYALAIGYYL
jgi:phage terminase large subunit